MKVESFNWTSLIAQIPVVALFAWVILKIFYKTKEFVDSILSRHENFLSTTLNSHRQEREKRDEEWREWLLNQRQSYLNVLENLTKRVEDHHSNSIKQASEILQLLKEGKER